MSTDIRSDLKTEYSLLQTQYEGFDQRALTIKSWAAPLLAGGVGLGAKEFSIALVLAVMMAAVCLWILEAIWKSFQYSYTERIKLLEAYFRSEVQEDLRPFQIFTAWVDLFDRHFKHPRSLVPILKQPFVYLPYLPIILFGLIVVAVLIVKG